MITGRDRPAVMAIHELKLPRRQQARAVSMKNSINETRSDNFEFDKISEATLFGFYNCSKANCSVD